MQDETPGPSPEEMGLGPEDLETQSLQDNTQQLHKQGSLDEKDKVVKEFSREHSQEERRDTADKIRGGRKEYFDRKQSVGEQTQDLVSKATEKQEELSEVSDEVKWLKEKVDENRRTILRRITRHLETKRLTKEIDKKTPTKERLEQEYRFIQDTIQSNEQQIEDRHELEEARETLREFYKGQHEKLEAFEKEKAAKEIENITKKYDVIFIHGIHPSFTPKSNSLVEQGVDWETKLKIALSLEPTLSASTIKSEDTFRNMWSRMGIILNGGSVVSASSSDAGTVAEKLSGRTEALGYSTDIAVAIDNAIKHRAEGYNEFVVENPKIAGFYVSLDDTGAYEIPDLVPFSQISETAKEFGLDVYAIKNGRVYESSYDMGKETYKLGEPVSPTEFTQKRFQLPDLQRRALIEEILAERPFRINFPEAQYVDSRSFGRQTFIELNRNHIISSHKEGKVGSIPTVAGSMDYRVENGELIGTKHSKHMGDYERHVKEQEFNHGYIQVGFGTFGLDKPITNNKSYLTGMHESLQEFIAKRDEGTRSREEIEYLNHILRLLVFHLRGFLEEAAGFDYKPADDRAISLANEVLPENEYQEVLARRLDKNGQFTMQIEDIS